MKMEKTNKLIRVMSISLVMMMVFAFYALVADAEASIAATDEPIESTTTKSVLLMRVTMDEHAPSDLEICWQDLPAAGTYTDTYVLYLAKCNYKGKTYSFKKDSVIKASDLSRGIGEENAANVIYYHGLKKNTAYKMYMVARDEHGKTISKSATVHFFTNDVRGKYTNPRSIKLSKTSYTLQKGKSAKIKASVTKVKKGKKLATSHAKKLRYTSDNPKVATVNSKGKITAKSPGRATIYVQTINGIWKTCKVKIK